MSLIRNHYRIVSQIHTCFPALWFATKIRSGKEQIVLYITLYVISIALVYGIRRHNTFSQGEQGSGH